MMVIRENLTVTFRGHFGRISTTEKCRKITILILVAY